MNTNAKIFVGIIGLLFLGMIATIIVRAGGGSLNTDDHKYDAFATCLKDKGAVFYGAFWCPHCQAQKKLFGASVKLLPYVECSTPDGNGQTQICIDKDIKGYPTWIFADGSILNGEIPLQQLAEKTSCTLPDAATAPVLPTSETGTSSSATPATPASTATQ